MNHQAQPGQTPRLSRAHIQDCVQIPRKIPTRRQRWLSVSGGEFRNTGFCVTWEIQTIYAGYSLPLSAPRSCNNAALSLCHNTLAMLHSGAATQSREALAGIRQVVICLGETEAQKMVSSTALKERIARNARDAGEPQQVHGFLHAVCAGDHRGIRQNVVRSGRNARLQSRHPKCSANHLPLDLVLLN